MHGQFAHEPNERLPHPDMHAERVSGRLQATYAHVRTYASSNAKEQQGMMFCCVPVGVLSFPTRSGVACTTSCAIFYSHASVLSARSKTYRSHATWIIICQYRSKDLEKTTTRRPIDILPRELGGHAGDLDLVSRTQRSPH
jgi:hypothetical protein